MRKFIDWQTLDLKGKFSGTIKIKCPECNSTRTNKSDRSLSVNVSSGVAKCHYCEALSFRDSIKKETERNYVLPVQTWANYTNLSAAMVKYCESRKIQQFTLNEMQITEEKFYQPKHNKEVNNIVFNYFEGETVVNKKYRSGDKGFTQSKEGKPIFYNINSAIGQESLYIVEGEFDVLALVQIGIKNVVSVPSGANDNDNYWINSEPYLKDVKKFYIAVDNDQKGNELAVEFLTKKRRLNALNTYLDSFVVGIQRWTRDDNLLHAGFNQTVTSTGRLSSSNPNFQNQPKNSKFPVRKCVVSRFTNGSIIEADFSGLEFVVAGELSRDPQIIEDILNGKDVHRQTASIVHQIKPEEVTKPVRNSVKPHTFAPLYGATGANEPPHIKTYYQEFFNIYKRHGEWQHEKMDDVISTGVVVTPSGREYAFPGTTRLRGGKTTNSTKIVNYPVQGFATGYIVPLSCVRVLRRFKELNLQSKLILTVHDSIVVDTHPDETRLVHDALVWAMTGASEEIKTRWKYEMLLPLKCEVSIGPNWDELETME